VAELEAAAIKTALKISEDDHVRRQLLAAQRARDAANEAKDEAWAAVRAEKDARRNDKQAAARSAEKTEHERDTLVREIDEMRSSANAASQRLKTGAAARRTHTRVTARTSPFTRPHTATARPYAPTTT
jgi:hypothetical protein